MQRWALVLVVLIAGCSSKTTIAPAVGTTRSATAVPSPSPPPSVTGQAAFLRGVQRDAGQSFDNPDTLVAVGEKVCALMPSAKSSFDLLGTVDGFDQSVGSAIILDAVTYLCPQWKSKLTKLLLK